MDKVFKSIGLFMGLAIHWLMWFMFLVSLAISIPTIIVTFGIGYIKYFSNFLPLEISLSITFFLWGINGLINKNYEEGKWFSIFVIAQSIILCIIMYNGIYL